MSLRHEHKIKYCFAFMALAFFALFTRLYVLQVLRGDSFRQRSESNFIQERNIKHSRGKIYDRYGRILVDNRQAYDLFITFALLPDSLKNLRALAVPLGIAKKDLLAIDKDLLALSKENQEAEIILAEDASAKSCNAVSEVLRTQLIDGVNIYFENASNDAHCRISIDSKRFPSNKQTFDRLHYLLDMEKDDFVGVWQRAHKKAAGLGRFKPNLLVADIGFDAYARIENAITLGSLSGVTVVPSKRRRYVYGNFATHVIGYLNQVSIADIEQGKGVFKSGDYIGRRGVEASYEEHLRGKDGIERVIVDAKGRRFNEAWEEDLLGSLRFEEQKAGASLSLSLDFELQSVAEKEFAGLSGSVIVLDVHTGFVLALASFPGFDPNHIVGPDNAEFFRQLLNDKTRPFRNKAIQDHYMPGSTFKTFTAIAGLEKRLINPRHENYCSGTFKIHKTEWRCFKREGHGSIALSEAIKVSCDSYFFDLGYRLGLSNLAETSFKLGFGNKTGIDLADETRGIVPNADYYRKRLGYVAPGFVVNMAIGQGDITVTPLQLAVAYAAIANGGLVLKPQLVQEIIDDDGNVIKSFDKQVISDISSISSSFKDILEGLSYVAEPGGTAHSLRYRPDLKDISSWINAEHIRIVGKTGTSQVVKLSKTVDHLEVLDTKYEHRDHAWFVSLYPKIAPQIVVVVMTEHGGFGGSTSAPVAARIMKRWHELNAAHVAQAG